MRSRTPTLSVKVLVAPGAALLVRPPPPSWRARTAELEQPSLGSGGTLLNGPAFAFFCVAKPVATVAAEPAWLSGLLSATAIVRSSSKTPTAPAASALGESTRTTALRFTGTYQLERNWTQIEGALVSLSYPVPPLESSLCSSTSNSPPLPGPFAGSMRQGAV